MKRSKAIYQYLLEAVFLAPIYAYVVLLVFAGCVFALLAILNSSSDGFESLAAILLLFYAAVSIIMLLLWRAIHLGSYIKALNMLSVLSLLLLVVLSFVDYPSLIRQETEKRDSYILANEAYALKPDSRFDTSVPAEWIRSDSTIRNDARRKVVGDLATNISALLFLTLPLVTMRIAKDVYERRRTDKIHRPTQRNI